MKLRATLAVLAVTALVVGILAPSGVAAGKKKKSGPVVVATDDPADWGANVDPTIAPAGVPLGMEILEASIGLSEDKKDIHFIIKLAGPSAGGIPELVRYGWEFSVDGNAFQISGGRTEFARGLCNPLHTDPACPPNVGDPTVLGNFPFFIRSGACTVGAECVVHAWVNATFDVAENTITIPVPLETVDAKLGSKIGPLGGLFGSIYAAPGAVVTTNGLPHDAISIHETYKIPKK